MALFFSIFGLLWLAVNGYVAWRLGVAIPAPFGAVVAGALLVVALVWPFVIAATRGAPADGPVAWLRGVAWTHFGALTVLLVLLVARDAALGVLGLVARMSVPFDPERRLAIESATAVAALVGTGAIGALGWRGANRLAPVVRVEVPITGLDARLDGFRIAQISDIHIGQPLTRDELARIVDRTNALGADLIAVTGDLVDGRVDVFASDTDPIRDLTAPHGVFFVTGNHEYYSGAKAWEREIASRGLTVLTNEHRVLNVDGAAVVVAGVTDYTAGQFVPEDASDPAKALSGAPADVLRLLLAHQPKSVIEAAKVGAHLQLSGHTHGGQYWPFTLLIDLFHPVTSGLSRFEDVWVYVSRGTGVWGPRMRVGAPNEITELVLRSA